MKTKPRVKTVVATKKPSFNEWANHIHNLIRKQYEKAN